MAFKRKVIKYVDLPTMQAILDCFKDTPERVVFGPRPEGSTTHNVCYIEEGKTELKVTCNIYKTATYVFKLDGSIKNNNINGMDAYSIMCRYAKPQHVEDFDIDLGAEKENWPSCSGILYENMKFKGKRVPAWSYDVNSAFSTQMLEPLPDLATARINDVIGENEIGFNINPNFAPDSHKEVLTAIFEPGMHAQYVFKLMESPYKKFVEAWYNNKKCAKNAQEKDKAKMVLNASIGYLQKINPFWRSCIIHRCNKFINGLKDENTIYSNTDCIVSAVRRPDIEVLLGDGLGQFKLEHPGEMFAWSPESMIYQWGNNIPVARGIPKGWFEVRSQQLGRPFDLLIDEIPNGLNKYYFNPKTLEITEAEYEEEDV